MGAGRAGVCWGARAVRLSAALDDGLARPDALVRCMAAGQGCRAFQCHPSQNGEKVWEPTGVRAARWVVIAATIPRKT